MSVFINSQLRNLADKLHYHMKGKNEVLKPELIPGPEVLIYALKILCYIESETADREEANANTYSPTQIIGTYADYLKAQKEKK